jgi:electron transfer flavoprotein beta subunit
MMKILVCVKQVPDVERIRLTVGSDRMVGLDISNEFRLNHFDEFAVEAAVRIKESVDGIHHIDAVTVGPSRAGEVLKRPMGMGVDQGIHLKIPEVIDPGSASVADWIADYACTREYDLILCGSMSEDGMNGQVGPMLAARLDIPYATQVIAIHVAFGSSEMSIEREIEGGVREMLNMQLPALLTLQPGIHIPRYPSLSKLLRAHQQGIKTIAIETPGAVNASVDCLGIMAPERRRASHLLVGSTLEKAEQLAAILKKKALV